MTPIGLRLRAREPRVSMVLPVELRAAGQTKNCYLVNLSVSGLCLEQAHLSLGQSLELSLGLNELVPSFQVEGEVRWIDPGPQGGRAGIQFKTLAPESRQLIQKILGLVIGQPDVMRAAASRIRLHEPSLRFLVVEGHPTLSALFEFEIRRMARNREWNVEIVTVADEEEYKSKVLTERFHAAIVDLDEFRDTARDLVATLRSGARQKQTAVVMISREVQPELNDLRVNTVFLRKPLSMPSLIGILTLVSEQHLAGVFGK